MADNVDHNVNTLDGKGTFHGMGIIACSTVATISTCPSTHSQLPPVKRQKISKAKDVIQEKGIPIIPFIRSECSGLSTVIFKKLMHLDFPYTLPTDMCLNIFWHASYFFKTARPSWSGYMQDVPKGDYHVKSNVMLMPIIDLDPSNVTCS